MRPAEGSLGSKAESILAAAERNFLASGFGAVSMDAIVRDAGVSKATVYAHFASKEALFGAVVARVSERHFRGFSEPDLDARNIAASLATLACRFLDLLLSAEGIALNRIMIGEVTRFPALGDVFWQAGPERSRVQIEAFLRRAVAAGSLHISDTRLAAEQFAALARGEIHLRHLLLPGGKVGESELRRAARAAAQTFQRAFGAPLAE
jgi:TetR/AcrR family transcriptional repressor of mexJK operon